MKKKLSKNKKIKAMSNKMFNKLEKIIINTHELELFSKICYET